MTTITIGVFTILFMIVMIAMWGVWGYFQNNPTQTESSGNQTVYFNAAIAFSVLFGVGFLGCIASMGGYNGRMHRKHEGRSRRGMMMY